MTELRTTDISYGEDYWNTFDGGLGYQDSVVWQDTAYVVKDLFGYDVSGTDLGGLTVLDVGCARGYLVKHLRNRGMDAWGCDVSVWALCNPDPDSGEFLRFYDLTSGDAPHWEAEYFDRVVCLETMEHIPESSVDLAFSTVRDLMKPGALGFFAICTDDQPGWESDPTHICIKSREWWWRKFLSLGFKIRDDLAGRVLESRPFKGHNGIVCVEKIGDAGE